MRGIHRSPVNSSHKGQWRRTLMFSLIYVWVNGWVNNREAGDLRRHCAHYDVSVMDMNLHPLWKMLISVTCVWNILPSATIYLSSLAGNDEIPSYSLKWKSAFPLKMHISIMIAYNYRTKQGHASRWYIMGTNRWEVVWVPNGKSQ